MIIVNIIDYRFTSNSISYIIISHCPGVIDGKAIDLQLSRFTSPSIVSLGESIDFQLQVKVILIGHIGFPEVEWPDYNLDLSINIIDHDKIG